MVAKEGEERIKWRDWHLVFKPQSVSQAQAISLKRERGPDGNEPGAPGASSVPPSHLAFP